MQMVIIFVYNMQDKASRQLFSATADTKFVVELALMESVRGSNNDFF